ncbi:hypothetical protein [Hydrogenimonas sp. SS33]|uniref:tetratricopeptide repeat protein n=1 Tax=Hydrogenimonas leucolamina TaxID=2954236 RepID=UPI00336BBE1B
MREIEELEKAWRRYKLKQRLPLYLVTGSVVIASVLFLLWPHTDSSSTSPVSIAPAVHPSPQPKVSETPPGKTESRQKVRIVSETDTDTRTRPVNPSEEKIVSAAHTPPARQNGSEPSPQKRKEIVLAPDTSFLEKLSEEPRKMRYSRPATPIHHEVIAPAKPQRQTSDLRSDRASHFSSSKRPTEQNPPKLRKRDDASAIDIVKSEAPEKGDGEITISTKKTNHTLEYLVKRFNQNRDPKLAAYIAQSFFNKKNYREAIRWSIIANSLEPSNENSWLLYAKAKVKLGQRGEAVRALKIYLNQYPSRKVKAYLETLESGL